MMDNSYLLMALEWLVLLWELPVTQYVWQAAKIHGPEFVFYAYIGRTLHASVGRWFGIFHPGHYRWWPRLPWRGSFNLLMVAKRWHERVFKMGKKSTGGFVGVLGTFALLFKPGMIYLGNAYAYGVGLLQPVGVKVQRHLMMIAMTGAAKTVQVITMIVCSKLNAFVVDPKGQVIRALMKLGGLNIFQIDLDNQLGTETARFNPFDCIKAAMKRAGDNPIDVETAAVRWATFIADALVIVPKGAKTPYFYTASREFIKGLILFILDALPEEQHNLIQVRRFIIQGYVIPDDGDQRGTTAAEAHDFLLHLMGKNEAFGGAIIGAVAAIRKASGETGGNVWSTLSDETAFLDYPKFQYILTASSFDLEWLKTRVGYVVALVASVGTLRQQGARFSRLLTILTARTFEEVKRRKSLCLFVVDELVSQGFNDVFLWMLAVGRSYGVIFLGIIQNLELLKATYPDQFKTFLGQADVVIWMGSADEDNKTYLCKALGKVTKEDKDKQTGRISTEVVNVMDEDQIDRFLDPDGNRIIVTRAGKRALRLVKGPYFRELPVWAYSPDPDHKEAVLRRLTRSILSPVIALKAQSSNHTQFEDCR